MLEKKGGAGMYEYHASGDDIGQALAARLCASRRRTRLRAVTTPIVESEPSRTSNLPMRARSAARRRLGIASKALASDSSDTGRLLNTALVLLKGAEEGKQNARNEPDLPGSESNATGSIHHNSRTCCRGACALITRSAVKDEIAHGSGRCAQALQRICAVLRRARCRRIWSRASSLRDE